MIKFQEGKIEKCDLKHSERNTDNPESIHYIRNKKEFQERTQTKLLEKLREGLPVDSAILYGYFPRVTAINYEELKTIDPEKFERLYDSKRGCPTPEGWLEELRILYSNTQNPYVDISNKIVEGTTQHRELVMCLEELTKHPDIEIVSYLNEKHQKINEYANESNYNDSNKNDGRTFTRYNGIIFPKTIELKDNQIDEAKTLLQNILDAAIIPGKQKEVVSTAAHFNRYTFQSGSTHEIND